MLQSTIEAAPEKHRGGSIIYYGTLLVQTNAHIKPRGKRKALRPDEMEHRNVPGMVWCGDDVPTLNKRKHTIGMICKLLNIKNRDAVKIKKILYCKTVGTSNIY
ncbi:MAG: hypothetical protein GY822_14430 [Deltaproteobacteria bacterium]|nr:hypothetical protein [Deltaproteobacteria bacterium]